MAGIYHFLLFLSYSNYLHDSFMNIFFYDNQTGVQEGNNKNNRQQHGIYLAEAELLLYQQEPSIRLDYEEGSAFSC